MSRTSVIWVLTGAALIALAIALEQRLADSDDPTAPIVVDGKQALPASPPPTLHPTSSTSNHSTTPPVTPLGPDFGSDRVLDRREPALVREATAPSLHETGAPRDDASDAANTEPEDADPAAVIGRPFPVSASVTAECQRYGCPELDQPLAHFAQEPRDLTWAREMETKLREFILADSGQFTIRNIECRTSLCVIEVASVRGQFLDGLYLNPTLHTQLLFADVVHGHERTGITVTLIPYTRR